MILGATSRQNLAARSLANYKAAPNQQLPSSYEPEQVRTREANGAREASEARSEENPSGGGQVGFARR